LPGFADDFVFCIYSKVRITYFLRHYYSGLRNVSNVPLSAMLKDIYALSDLENKNVNIDTELSSATIHDTAILKKITGRQPIRIQRKNQRAYDALLHAKPFFSGNELPHSEDDTDAYHRRNVIINFPNLFEGERADPKLRCISNGKDNTAA
jgi:putative DNA primase/helicase